MALSQSSKILVSDINSALDGKQDALGYTPVKTVNNVSPNSAGNVTISTTPSTVKGVLGSAWAANSTSMTLPSGGTWFVWNSWGNPSSSSNSYYGVTTSTSTNSTAYNQVKNTAITCSGGSTIYAVSMSYTDGYYYRHDNGKPVAIRIA